MAAEPGLVERALDAAEANHPEEALRLFGEAEREAAGKVLELGVIRLFRGSLLVKLKRWPEALRDLDAAAPVVLAADAVEARFELCWCRGQALAALQRWPEAIDALRAAAGYANGPAWESMVRILLAETYWHDRQDDKGREEALAAADLARSGEQSELRAQALEWAAVCSARLADPSSVERYWLQAAQLRAGLGQVAQSREDRARAEAVPADVRGGLALLDKQLADPALTPSQRAMAAARAGNLHLYLGDLPQALRLYDLAAGLYEQSGERDMADQVRAAQAYSEPDLLVSARLYEQAHAPLEAARAYLRAGRSEQGLELLERAYQDVEKPVDRARVLSVRGLLLRDLLRWDEAEEAYRQAESQCPPDELALTAEILSNRAEMLHTLGKLDPARELYLKALDLHADAIILSNLGTLYFDQGDYARSLETLTRARDLADDDRAQGVVLTALGRTYQFLGRGEKARECYQQALVHRKLDRDTLGQAYTLNNLGASYLDDGQPELAPAYFREALPLAGEGPLKAILLTNLATEASLAEALALERKLGLEDMEGPTLHALAYAASDPERKLELCDQALEVERRFTRRQQEAETLTLRGLALEKLGRRGEAIETLRKATALLEEMAAGLASSSKAGFVGRNLETYDLLIRLLLEEGDVPGAFQVTERSRARAFLQLLEQRALPLRAPVSLVQREHALRQELRALMAGQHPPRPEAAVKGELAQVLEEIRQASPETAALREVSVPEVAALQRALGPDRVLLEYQIPSAGPARLFILTREKLRVAELDVTRDELKEKVSALRRLLVQQEPARELLDELGAKLMAPARAELAGCQAVLVAPSDCLHYLPFAALRLDGAYLLDSVAVAQLPSAAAWMAVRSRPAGEGKGVALAALGNLSVSWKDPLEVGSSERGGFTPLPGTLTEVRTIAELYPRPAVLLEDRMTSQNLRQAVQDARLVHLATHGILDARAPLFSGLVASDELITVSEIFDWRTRADLVVLSACQSGLGGFESARGDDMVGLSRAFQFAGCRSVLASLWKVSDEATALWMIELHRGLSGGESPLQATRAAALKVREGYPEPYYWAPFVLMGAD